MGAVGHTNISLKYIIKANTYPLNLLASFVFLSIKTCSNLLFGYQKVF